MAKNVFTPEEIAERLGLNIRTIYQHLRTGKLPAAKPGNTYIITRSDLAAYLDSEQRVDELFGKEA